MRVLSLPGRAGLLASSVILLLAATAHGQIPEEFTNLQVLPKDIESRQLVSIMKGFTSALGVRCNYCHVGEARTLEGMDFATDENEHKGIARDMMKMVSQIRGDVEAALDEPAADVVQVQCVTCHRGVTKPRLTQDVLERAYDEGGIDAAVSKYEELRQDYYGTHSYDFSERMLEDVAQDWMRAEHLDDAQTILELNAKHYPKSAFTYALLGQIHLQKDEKDAAIEAWKKSLQLDPSNERLQRMLERLEG
jgi:hypothetical protein